MRRHSVIFILSLVVLLPTTAGAAPCSGNPHALGTERVLAVNAASTPRLGRKQFPATLRLAPKELMLTFDDGPSPTTTPKVLDALKAECVRATFFLVGRNVAAHPALARRELAEGHTLGNHTYSHPLLDHMPLVKAEAEINRGFATEERVLYGRRSQRPPTPFFRFPGFAASPALLTYLQQRGIVVFGADIWASDWNPMTPQHELALILHRLDKVDRGIVLLHDTKAETARMLPGPSCACSNGAATISCSWCRPGRRRPRRHLLLLFCQSPR